MEMTKKERKIFENNFKIYEDNECYEIETWTDGGVDMIIHLDKNNNKTATQQFIDYIDNFDIDEEIDLLRQSEEYKQHFSISSSLNDFNDWLNWLEKIKENLTI